MNKTYLFAAALAIAPLLAQNPSMADKMGKMKAQMQAKMQAKMAAGEMGEMAHHREVTQLVEKLSQSVVALQAEKDPAALAKKLAEHAALLKELQAKVAEHGKTVQSEEPATAAPADPHAEHH